VPILVVAEAAGQTAEQDAAMVKAVDLAGSPPPGGRIRMAGPTANGWRIVSLRDSEADWERFRNEAGSRAGGRRAREAGVRDLADRSGLDHLGALTPGPRVTERGGKRRG
jgi:hypothetical protein